MQTGVRLGPAAPSTNLTSTSEVGIQTYFVLLKDSCGCFERVGGGWGGWFHPIMEFHGVDSGHSVTSTGCFMSAVLNAQLRLTSYQDILVLQSMTEFMGWADWHFHCIREPDSGST